MGDDKMVGRAIAQRYWTILEINRAAISEPGLNQIFRRTYEPVKKAIPCDRMALSLYAPEDGALKLAAVRGQGPDSFYQVGLRLECNESHHGWVFQHQKAILRRDLRTELEFLSEQHNVQEGIRSYCAVPLILRGESLGVIIVLSSQKSQYSKAHAEFLQQVSDQLALAIKSFIPFCPKHVYTKMICPRCVGSHGGQATATKHQAKLSDWGKQGGRGRKKHTSIDAQKSAWLS